MFRHGLGVGSKIIGKTTFCPDIGSAVKIIGGPQDPQVSDIKLLNPDLIIANQEENGRAAVMELCGASLPVWLTFPKTVNQMIGDLWKLSELFRDTSVMERIRVLEKSIEWAGLAAVDQSPVSYFCPIWEDRLETGERWWMTFNQDTYSADVLRLINGKNIFANRLRKYPLLAELDLAEEESPADRDTRYPRVGYQEILEAQPEVVLLPNEPYEYKENDRDLFREQFKDIPAVRNDRVFLIEGSYIHWPGTILARTLNELAQIFAY